MNRNELDQYLEIINNVLTQSATKVHKKHEFLYRHNKEIIFSLEER